MEQQRRRWPVWDAGNTVRTAHSVRCRQYLLLSEQYGCAVFHTVFCWYSLPPRLSGRGCCSKTTVSRGVIMKVFVMRSPKAFAWVFRLIFAAKLHSWCSLSMHNKRSHLRQYIWIVTRLSKSKQTDRTSYRSVCLYFSSWFRYRAQCAQKLWIVH